MPGDGWRDFALRCHPAHLPVGFCFTMRRGAVLLLICAALVPAPAAARPGKGERLLTIVAPATTTKVPAHPFVNVILRFSADGQPDPTTFRARLGGVNVTSLFDPIVEKGAVVGMRGSLGPALLVIGNRRSNRLRLEVRGRIGKRRVHDIDRLRFAALDVADEAPVARALAARDVILPGVPQQFDASQSHDPESDSLTYLWDFGDGATSTDPRPVHTYAAAMQDVTVRLTVSDAQRNGTDQLDMVTVPPLQPGRTAGLLRVEAAGPLEFGGVTPGASGTRTFTVRNLDETPTSELRVRLGTSAPGFTVSREDLDLAAGESASVDVVFAPGSVGHQSSLVTLSASASNQTVLHLLAHGYGGAVPGAGPIPTTHPVFYSTLLGTQMIFPNGLEISADDTVHTCVGGASTGDYCLTDADCSVNGGTCPTTGTCIRGDRAGQSCTTAKDCPNGRGCTSATPFDPIDTCGDGEGGAFMLSDENTFTDQTGNDTEISETLMHLHFDANGNRTGAEIVARISSGTSQLTCDAIPAGQGGQAYLAEYRAVPDSNACFRDAREALVARRKTNGADNALMSRIDAAENNPECEDYDPVTDLHITPDADAVFASLPNTGLWRIRPTPLLIVPNFDDFFQVHPDGSVIVVRASDLGPTGLLRVYKISPDVAVHGAPNLDQLTPCATMEVPNNNGRTIIDTTYAVDQSAPGSFDGTILVSFAIFGGQQVVSTELVIRATAVFTALAGSASCNALGFVNLELLDDVSF
jgi:PKD repeat protein